MSDNGTGALAQCASRNGVTIGLACFEWSAYTACRHKFQRPMGLRQARASPGSVSRSSSSISRRAPSKTGSSRGEPRIHPRGRGRRVGGVRGAVGGARERDEDEERGSLGCLGFVVPVKADPPLSLSLASARTHTGQGLSDAYLRPVSARRGAERRCEGRQS